MIASRKTLLLATAFGMIVFGPLLVRLYWPAVWPLDAADHAVGRDFVNLWVGGKLLAEGNWPALFDVQAYQEALHRIFHAKLAPHVWSYPPTSFLLAAPLAALPYGAALAVWSLSGLAAFAAVARIGLDGAQARSAVLLGLLAPATLLNLICGQNGFVTAALLGGGVLLLERRPWLAGVLIGALSYKPHFGLVIAPMLLLLGAWRTLAAAALAAAAMVLVSIAIYGMAPWQAFLTSTMPYQALILQNFQGFFTTMLVSPYASLRHLGFTHAASMGVHVGVAVVAIVVCGWGLRRTRDAETRLALVATATFLVTPYALTYDLPVIALVVLRHALRKPDWTTTEAVIYGSAWALPLLSVHMVMFGLPIAWLVSVALLVVICNYLRLIRDPRLVARPTLLPARAV